MPYLLGWIGAVLVALAATGAVFIGAGEVRWWRRRAVLIAAVLAAALGAGAIASGMWLRDAQRTDRLIGELYQTYGVQSVAAPAIGEPVVLRWDGGLSRHCELTGSWYAPLVTCDGVQLPRHR